MKERILVTGGTGYIGSHTVYLYVCEVELSEGKNWVDKDSRRFGFRWFEASGIGADAVFRLNGKRIMLRSAISWSFWPLLTLHEKLFCIYMVTCALQDVMPHERFLQKRLRSQT